ncbi:MAG: N-acetyltransferase [Lachnospiraceae bacterium]|nr:N-acetyltransferase [Lachnospiraceae bacterium]
MESKKAIRLATKADAAALLEIYKKYITDTAVTFEIEVPSVESFAERIETITATFPWLICEIDGRVAGYAYASKHGERAAYRWSADLSVYIDERYHRKHIATALYTALLELLRKQGYYTVYAGVSTPNPDSEAFHTAFGFRNLGVFENVGYKLGEWRGVTWFELPLRKYEIEPKETVPVSVLEEKNMMQEVLEAADKQIG